MTSWVRKRAVKADAHISGIGSWMDGGAIRQEEDDEEFSFVLVNSRYL